jgi:hypothetical protein
MLTRWQIERELRLLTYKEGWEWSLLEDEHEGLYVRWIITLPDSYNPGETVDLGINSWLPPIPDRDYLAKWFLWRVKRIESHEAREFLKRDGVILFDPHAEAA